MNQAVRKFDFIDALRGWAALAVVFVHLSLWIKPESFLLATISHNGMRGVQLFFVASALTLMLSMDSRMGREKHAIRNFFIRRVFRIAPLFYFGIVLYLLRDGVTAREYAPEGLSLIHFLTTLTFTHGWLPTTINAIVPGGWSIAVEMNFYFLLPVAYLFIKTIHQAVFVTFTCLIGSKLLGIVALKLYQSFFEQHEFLLDLFISLYWLPTQAAVFCMGFVLYFMFKKIPDDKPDQNRRLLGVMYLAISVYLMMSLLFSDLKLFPPHFAWAVALTLFAYSLALFPNILFVNPLTRAFGKVSYSLYILHFAVLSFFQYFTPTGLFDSHSSLWLFVMFIPVMLVSYTLSVFSYRWIEVPGVELGNRLITRLEDKQS